MDIVSYVKELDLENESATAWNSVMFLYSSALKKARTKVEILNDEFMNVHNYTPIENIKSRLKKPESIAKKLKRNGFEDDLVSMVSHCYDIAGIRVVCSFNPDIPRIANMISKQPDVTITTVKDYITNPKDNGYKSYHMLGTIPVYLTTNTIVEVPVEIQLRTIAMDFWASLEHKIYYKFEGDAPAYIREDLKEAAQIISTLDAKMLQLNDVIHNVIRDGEQ